MVPTPALPRGGRWLTLHRPATHFHEKGFGHLSTLFFLLLWFHRFYYKCHPCWAGEVGEKSGPGWEGGKGGEEGITSAPGPQTAALATEAECLPGAQWMRPTELSRRVTPAALPVVFVSGPLNFHYSSLAGYGQDSAVAPASV